VSIVVVFHFARRDVVSLNAAMFDSAVHQSNCLGWFHTLYKSIRPTSEIVFVDRSSTESNFVGYGIKGIKCALYMHYLNWYACSGSKDALDSILI